MSTTEGPVTEAPAKKLLYDGGTYAPTIAPTLGPFLDFFNAAKTQSTEAPVETTTQAMLGGIAVDELDGPITRPPPPARGVNQISFLGTEVTIKAMAIMV
jgi:hypothetical protein